jgi:hypothetical protein
LHSNVNKDNNNNEQSYRWLKFGNIKGETESTIMAAQDNQIVQTILKIKFWPKKFIVNAGYVNDMKLLTHRTSGSPILPNNEYLMRCGKVGAH